MNEVLNLILHAYATVARRDLIAAQQRCRPSILLNASVNSFISNDGQTRWLCDRSGVFAIGDSPDEACLEFDRVWMGVN